MPIFEFVCKQCNHQFEELILGSDSLEPACPKCSGTHVEKLMSAASFRPNGIPTGAGGFSAPACKTTPGGG